MTTSVRIATLLCALFVALPSVGDSVDDLFDPSRLLDVRISMPASDWSNLRAGYLTNTYYDVTITIDGETISDAAIRSRGSGTRNGVKPGLRVDFNRINSERTFRGFRSLVLDNMYNDASFLRERLVFSVFREAGLTVPRESFARLTVNDQYWGLYAIVEPVDKVFVTRHVDAGDGNLFEYKVPTFPSPDQLPGWDFALSRGNTVEDYVPVPFKPETNKKDLDASALLAFIRTISKAPDQTFVSDISRFIDPYALLTYYAVETASSEVDGLTSFFGVNNFYLYQLEGMDFFLFIPWDHDFNFVSAYHSIYHGLDRNRLLRRLLFDAEMKTFYEQTVRSIANRFVNPAWMHPRIDSMVELIHAAVLEDTKRRGGDDSATAAQTFEDAIAGIRTVIDGRGASIDAQLGPRHRPVRR